MKTVKTAKGQTVLVDLALLASRTVPIAVIGSTGNFSGKILGESNVFAFAVEDSGKGEISAEDIYTILASEGYGTGNGLVVLNAASKRNVDFVSSMKGLLQVDIVGEVELDHALSLLASCNSETK